MKINSNIENTIKLYRFLTEICDVGQTTNKQTGSKERTKVSTQGRKQADIQTNRQRDSQTTRQAAMKERKKVSK